MRSAISLMLVICLGGAPAAVTAQERAVPPPDPIRQFIVREAVRLAAEQAVASALQQAMTSDWARVKALAPGREITVFVKGSDKPMKRYFVGADDDGLTVSRTTTREVIEHIERPNVVELAVPGSAAGRKALWAAVGTTAGFLGGLALGGSSGCCGDDPGLQGAVIMAPLLAVLGGLIGASYPKGKPESIYRASS